MVEREYGSTKLKPIKRAHDLVCDIRRERHEGRVLFMEQALSLAWQPRGMVALAQARKKRHGLGPGTCDCALRG